MKIARLLLTIMYLTTVSITASAQHTRSVKGRVTDSDGMALPGVTVFVSGSTEGTVSDGDGKWVLKLKEGDERIEFALLGYASVTEKTGSRSEINVTMYEEATRLEETVVIGYSTVAKRDLTGAVSSISEASVSRDATGSLEGLLSGRAAGVSVSTSSGEPGGGMSIRIRGQSSLNSGISPLYIVDGVPIDMVSTVDNDDGASLSPLIGVDPSDIASIDILKDAASASIYGSRGANGVVIITTRRGRSERPVVSFSATVGINMMANHLAVLNGQEFCDMIYDSYVNAGQEPIWYTMDPLNPIVAKSPDWQDVLYRTSLNQKYNIGISGKNKKMKYAVSLNYTDNQGSVITTSMQKIGMRVNADYKATEWLEIGTSSNMYYSLNHRAGQGSSETSVRTALTFPPVFSLYQPDGELTGRMAGKVSPYAALQLSERIAEQNRFTTNEYMRFYILKGLTFESNLNYDFTYMDETYFQDKSLNNLELYMGRAIGTKRHSWVNENILKYNMSEGKHHISALLGLSEDSHITKRMVIRGQNFASSSIHTLNAAAVITDANTSFNQNSMISMFGRLNYDYAGKYLVTTSFRRDGSSRFGAGRKWGNFPSLQLGWRFSQEKWAASAKNWLSDGKLRASWALTGNESIGDYVANGQYGVAGAYLATSQIYPAAMPNPEMSWETTEQINVGTDLSFLNERISLTADTYLKYTYNLLFSENLPSTTGFSNIWRNLGNMFTQGLEFSVTTHPVVTRNVDWSINLNMAFDKTIVTKLPNGGADIESGVSIIREGEKVGSFYGWQCSGVYPSDEDNKYVRIGADGSIIEYRLQNGMAGEYFEGGDLIWTDFNKDGIIDEKDRTIIGCGQPLFYGGASTDLAVRRWTFSINTVFSYGNDIYNAVRATSDSMASIVNGTQDCLRRWKKQGDVTDVPKAVRTDPHSNARQSNRWIEDGSYFKVKSVNLSYAFPKFSVSLSATNLLTFTDYTGFDPELYSSDSITIGYDKGAYPSARSVLLGVKMNF